MHPSRSSSTPVEPDSASPEPRPDGNGYVLGKPLGGPTGSQHPPALDRLPGLVCRLLGVPAALVALGDGEHLALASTSGLSATDAAAALGFCRQVAAEGRLLEGAADSAACLGAPLQRPDGRVSGVLCAVGAQDRAWTEADRAALGEAAELAAASVVDAWLVEAAEREIAERSRTEDALRESEARFRALFNGAADAVIVYALTDDGPGLIEEANDVAVERYGYSREELLQMRPADLIDTSVVDHAAIIARLRREGSLITESQHLTKDGRSIPVEVSLHLSDFGGHAAVLTVSRDISERKTVERERALLAAIVASSDDAIVSKSLDGVITSWNAGAERIFGYTADEAIGQSVLMIIPPERHGEERMILDRLRRGERIDHFETVRVARGGQRLHISLTVSPIRDGRGRVVGASKVARDVTYQKEAEAVLRQRERQQAVVAELGHLALRHLGPGPGTLDAFMDRLVAIVAETLGVELSKVLELQPGGQFFRLRAGVGWREALVGQAEVPTGAASPAGFTLMSDEPVIVRDLREERRFRVPALLHEHGAVSGLNCTIPNAEGGAWGVLGAYAKEPRTFTRDDVHFLQAVANLLGAALGRQRIEEALKESEARFRTLVDSLPALVWMSDEDGRCTFVNAAWLAFTGRAAEEELGDGWAQSIHPEDRPRSLRAYANAFERRSPYEMEYRLRRHDGVYRWVLSRGIPRFAPDGAFLGYLSADLDIHDRRQAEARIRLLADAGLLLDRGLDYEATLRAVAAAAVPGFADWCAIDLVGEDGAPQRLAIAHANPEKVAWAEEVHRRYPPDFEAPYGVGLVLRTGRSELFPDIPPEVLAQVAQDEEHLSALQGLGMRSALIVPVQAGARVLGALTFVASRSEQRFGEADRAVAEELGRRAGGAIMSAQLHAALRENAERLRAVIDTTVDGIITIDERGTIESFNPAAVRIFGYTPEEVVGQNVNVLMPEPYRSEHDGYLAAYLATGQRRIIGVGREVVGRRKDGTTFPLELSVSETRLEGRRIFTGLVRDITQRKEAERALRESEARFRQLAEALPQIVYTLDAEGTNTLYLNPLWYEYTGLSEDTHFPIGSPEIIHPEDVPHVLASWAKALQEGQTLEMELRLRRRDGAYRWFITRAVPVRDADGRIVRWFGTSTDIHAQKETEAELEARVTERTAELERSNQELDQFAYVASHDLKAPLRAIDNLAAWIVEDAHEALPDPSKRHLDMLQGRVHRMERLLDDLLAYSRAGRDMGGREEIDTAALVDDVVELLDIPDEFALEVDENLPRVVSPRAPLEMVFRNLIANAVKHHDRADGHIRVWAQDAENPALVAFSVADDGPGIAPEYHERIFGLFQTLRPRDEVEGSGMGLAAVKKAVEARGGTVLVSSAPGAGTTFTFTWPRNPAPLP